MLVFNLPQLVSKGYISMICQKKERNYNLDALSERGTDLSPLDLVLHLITS